MTQPQEMNFSPITMPYLRHSSDRVRSLSASRGGIRVGVAYEGVSEAEVAEVSDIALVLLGSPREAVAIPENVVECSLATPLFLRARQRQISRHRRRARKGYHTDAVPPPAHRSHLCSVISCKAVSGLERAECDLDALRFVVHDGAECLTAFERHFHADGVGFRAVGAPDGHALDALRVG
jgi:hypothetical protein